MRSVEYSVPFASEDVFVWVSPLPPPHADKNMSVQTLEMADL